MHGSLDQGEYQLGQLREEDKIFFSKSFQKHVAYLPYIEHETMPTLAVFCMVNRMLS